MQDEHAFPSHVKKKKKKFNNFLQPSFPHPHSNDHKEGPSTTVTRRRQWKFSTLFRQGQTENVRAKDVRGTSLPGVSCQSFGVGKLGGEKSCLFISSRFLPTEGGGWEGKTFFPHPTEGATQGWMHFCINLVLLPPAGEVETLLSFPPCSTVTAELLC